jgi:hypothetical protein
MKLLQGLPSNFVSDAVTVNADSVTNQLPQFPNLPKLPTISQVGEQPNLEVDELITKILPETQINQLIEKYRLPDGTLNLDKAQEELNKTYQGVVDNYKKIADASRPPRIEVAGILASLLPKIPVPNVPNPVRIAQYIDNLVERKKRTEQQAIMKLQKLDAQLEETPFTAIQTRINNEFNNQRPTGICITTETGSTQEEALTKAEFKLKNVQKCTNKELQILNSKQENGVFIVTAGIL